MGALKMKISLKHHKHAKNIIYHLTFVIDETELIFHCA